jgi:agmatine deiminase
MLERERENKATMPGEWEPHKRVRLAWPYDTTTFGSLNEKDEKLNPNRIGKIEKLYIEILQALVGSENIKIFVQPGFSDPRIPKEAELVEIDYADVWTRDYMPTFIIREDKKISAIKWVYTAYGEKFGALVKDNEVWSKLTGPIETVETGINMEGGAIESNGKGTILTTEECLLARNPSMTKGEIEEAFKKYLGAEKVLWLSRGLVNDHTDGHIDEIARFVGETKIVCAYEDDQSHPNYEILRKNYEDLCMFTDQNGQKFEVIKLPMPHMTYANGDKAPASYCNFYISNKVVLVSTFNDANDGKAIEILERLFPERKIVPIDCSELIYGGGAIHCITAQEPLK